MHNIVSIILFHRSIQRYAWPTDTLPTSMFYYYHILLHHQITLQHLTTTKWKSSLLLLSLWPLSRRQHRMPWTLALSLVMISSLSLSLLPLSRCQHRMPWTLALSLFATRRTRRKVVLLQPHPPPLPRLMHQTTKNVNFLGIVGAMRNHPPPGTPNIVMDGHWVTAVMLSIATRPPIPRSWRVVSMLMRDKSPARAFQSYQTLQQRLLQRPVGWMCIILTITQLGQRQRVSMMRPCLRVVRATRQCYHAVRGHTGEYFSLCSYRKWYC